MCSIVVGKNTQETAAIIIGGAVGVGFLVIFLLMVKNAMKKGKHDGEFMSKLWWILQVLFVMFIDVHRILILLWLELVLLCADY